MLFQDAVHVQIANAGELDQLTGGHQNEIIGELDPKTGILYTSQTNLDQKCMAIDSGKISQITHLGSGSTIMGGSVVETVPSATVVAASNTSVARQPQLQAAAAPPPPHVDFLTDALSQAQINLDSYQYSEDGQEAGEDITMAATIDNTQQQQQQITVPTQQIQQQQGAAQVVVSAYQEQGAKVVTQQGLVSILGNSTTSSSSTSSQQQQQPQHIILNSQEPSPDGKVYFIPNSLFR